MCRTRVSAITAGLLAIALVTSAQPFAEVRAAPGPVQGQERDRAKIPDKYKWNLADLYPSDDAWRAAKEKLVVEIPKLGAFKGTLDSSPARLLEALETTSRVAKDFQRVYVYASMMSDQDTRVSKYQGMQQEMQQIAAKFGEQVAFAEPEILKIE